MSQLFTGVNHNYTRFNETQMGEIFGQGLFNVKAYGASGVGQQDDTTAFLDAINTMPSTGGTLFVPRGTYLLSESILTNSKSNVTIIGQGWGTVLKLADGANDEMFNLFNAVGWILRDFAIDGNRANQTVQAEAAIHLPGATHCRLENLYILNAWYAGIQIKSGSHNVIQGCRIVTPYNCAIYLEDTSCEHNVIANNYLGGTLNDGNLEIKYGPSYNLITGNYIDQAGDADQNGIVVAGGSTNTVGNRIINNMVYGDAGRTGSGIAVSDAYGIGTIIEGNYVTGYQYGIHLNGTRSTAKGNYATDCSTGFYIPGGTNIIEGNWSVANQLRGYSVWSNYNVLMGNFAMNNDQSATTVQGIQLTDTADYNVLIGNISYDDQVSKTQDYGIADAATCNNNIYIGNVVEGNAGQQLIINNATNFVSQNKGWVTEAKGAQASVADGGTITHGLAATPTVAVMTGSVANEFVSATTLGATTITVAIKKHDGSAGTTQTVYWHAWV